MTLDADEMVVGNIAFDASNSWVGELKTVPAELIGAPAELCLEDPAIVGRKGVSTYTSGLVTRYHTNPTLARTGQTNAQHQWGVLQLVLTLWPNASRALIVEAAGHDTGERFAGDLPAPVKRDNPDLAEVHRAYEDRKRAETSTIPAQQLTELEHRKLKLCDRLECVMWAASVAPHILESNDWRQMIAAIVDVAHGLDRGIEIEEIIENLEELGHFTS